MQASRSSLFWLSPTDGVGIARDASSCVETTIDSKEADAFASPVCNDRTNEKKLDKRGRALTRDTQYRIETNARYSLLSFAAETIGQLYIVRVEEINGCVTKDV